MFILWMFGLVSCAFLVFNVAKDQTMDGQIKKDIELANNQSTFYLTANKNYLPGNNILEGFDLDISIDDNFIYNNDIYLNIKKSENEFATLQLTYRSNGKSKKTAIENAKAIVYEYEIKGDSINFNSFLAMPKEARLRSQKLELILFLPLGKEIFIDESLKNIIYDIDNITNTKDKRMVGKKWIMLAEGLTCLDCEDIKGITSLQLDSTNAIEPIIDDILEE